jgi:Protein of unknown function (DUF3606)
VAKKATKKTTRGREQDRARVAGGQRYEVNYEAEKTGRSGSAVKKAVIKSAIVARGSNGDLDAGGSDQDPHPGFEPIVLSRRNEMP